ncbi:NHL repeat-containing protein [Pseudonocardia sp. NPDC049635]|uniref:NHL repeat-containing protein n=1 Tax=Pseudonocardia sp. NPDC049635 TaxID=3155506 RepID=UPI0033E0D933
MSRLTVRHSIGGRPTRVDPGTDPALAGGWAPGVRLGAPATGGLALPSATPSRSWMYSPRGVHLDPGLLAVADTGNHRVLLWHGGPDTDEQPADVVLGQPDATTEGRAAGGRGPANGMNLPTGVLVHDGRLVVADAWHHRILVWDSVPRSDDVAPDLVLGQPGPDSVEPNAGGACSAATFYWPFGVGIVDGRFWVADTGNRRVLGWDGGIPGPGRPADVVLGQPGPAAREENRGEGVGPASFRWPHAVTGRDGLLLVADAGNHRVLGWAPAPDADRPAGFAIGQPGLDTGDEWPYAPQTAAGLRFPYSACLDPCGDRFAVADTANNRVLLWDTVPTDGRGARHVLAQPDFAGNGENRWAAVLDDTLCWPYGLSLHGDRLAVCDSGNNRVVLWHRTEAGS